MPGNYGVDPSAALLKTVVDVGPFYPQLMRELIVKLLVRFNNPNSPNYHKVHIRGICFNISLSVINSLGRSESPLLGEATLLLKTLF